MSVAYQSYVCRICCPGDDSCNRTLSLVRHVLRRKRVVPGYRCTLVQRYLSREVAQPCPVHVRVVTAGAIQPRRLRISLRGEISSVP